MEETKYQKAFRLLLDEYYSTPKRWEDYLTLKQCVERETVLFIDENTKDKFYNSDEWHSFHTVYKCPCCGKMLHYNGNYHINYCPECGQRIARREDYNKDHKVEQTCNGIEKIDED